MKMRVNRKQAVWLAIGLLVLAVLLVRIASGGMDNPFGSARAFGIWLAAFLTLSIMSFLYRDNPCYRFAEHLFVGVSAAYWMVMGFWSTLVPNLFGKLAPSLASRWFLSGLAAQSANLFYLVPLAFGILLLMRLSPKGGHVSRWALAFILGTTAGLRLIAFLTADFMVQTQSTLVSVAGMSQGSFAFERMFWNIVMVVAVLAALCYFYFSKAHTGAFGRFSRLGVWVLMITFGAGFGYTVMGRIALLVGRVEELLGRWLHVIS
jgi:hypothetical protein